jgi:hypothetical protein
MSEIIIQSKAVVLTIIVALVGAIAAGVIGYNLGVANGLKSKEQTNYLVAPNTDTYTYTPPVTNNQPTNTNTPVTPPPAEIQLSGEPVSMGGQTIITGKISEASAVGFTLDVTSQIVDTATRNVTEKTTSYKIKITADTKVTEYISTVIIPEGAGTPQITQSTKKLSARELKNGQSVTVVSNDDINTATLNALEVRVSTIVRK